MSAFIGGWRIGGRDASATDCWGHKTGRPTFLPALFSSAPSPLAYRSLIHGITTTSRHRTLRCALHRTSHHAIDAGRSSANDRSHSLRGISPVLAIFNYRDPVFAFR